MTADSPRITLRDDQGAAAVEFALVSTLLITLLLGIIAFGFALFKQQSALHGAREGARLAAVGVNDCDEFQAAVADRGSGAGIVAGEVTMSYTDINGGGPGPGDSVTVAVPYKIDLSVLGFIGLGNYSATQTGIARVETVGTVTSCS